MVAGTAGVALLHVSVIFLLVQGNQPYCTWASSFYCIMAVNVPLTKASPIAEPKAKAWGICPIPSKSKHIMWSRLTSVERNAPLCRGNERVNGFEQ